MIATNRTRKRAAKRPRRFVVISQGYARYEQIKAQLVKKAETPAEYERACRQAALIAGV